MAHSLFERTALFEAGGRLPQETQVPRMNRGLYQQEFFQRVLILAHPLKTSPGQIIQAVATETSKNDFDKHTMTYMVLRCCIKEKLINEDHNEGETRCQ